MDARDLNGNLKKYAPLIAIVLIVAIYAIMGGSSSDNSTDSISNNSSVAVDDSWIPANFVKWDNQIAYQYETKNVQCTDGELCIPINVITKNGCPSNLYVEIALKNKQNVQYAYTNATSGSLSPATIAQVKLETMQWQQFDHFDLTKISCY